MLQDLVSTSLRLAQHLREGHPSWVPWHEEIVVNSQFVLCLVLCLVGIPIRRPAIDVTLRASTSQFATRCSVQDPLRDRWPPNKCRGVWPSYPASSPNSKRIKRNGTNGTRKRFCKARNPKEVISTAETAKSWRSEAINSWGPRPSCQCCLDWKHNRLSFTQFAKPLLSHFKTDLEKVSEPFRLNATESDFEPGKNVCKQWDNQWGL